MLLTSQPILDAFKPDFSIRPRKKLAIVLIGDNKASQVFVAKKIELAKSYGILTEVIEFGADANESVVRRTMIRINNEHETSGIVVQLPLPAHLPLEDILAWIHSGKDVDNLTGTSPFLSPMVQAIDALNTHYSLDILNKSICLVGQGRLVGKPVYDWLDSLGCAPILVDKDTENGDDFIRGADVVISGTGVKHRINDKNTKPGQIILDCSGVDVDFEAIKDKVAAITPPKGAIGPLTVHFLLQNVLKTKS